jgi:hypothetical protein
MSGVTQFSFYNDLTVRGHRIQGVKTRRFWSMVNVPLRVFGNNN